MPALEDLLNLKTEMLNLKMEIGKLTRQRDGLLASVEQATQQLARTQQEANAKATAILADAKAEADASRDEVAAKHQALAQREADVTIRESAVAYIDEKLKSLADQEAFLGEALRNTEQIRAEASAQQQHWVSKLDELKAKEEALALRETSLSQPLND